MICAYCKSRVFDSDRKCQSCGSTVFLAGTVVSPPIARPEERIIQEERLEIPAWESKQRAAYGLDPWGLPYSSRNRWIALLLCVLAGYVGLHRFYTGRVASGIVYLLTGGVFGIGVVVDALSIAFGRFRDCRGMLLHS